MKQEIVLLELFSGIGGFAKGLQDAGYIIKKHYFSEVDKHAIANYKYNFKNAEYIGSVTNVRHIIRTIREFLRENPGVKLVITFGSPCQDFSLAGKGKGLTGTKSSLIKYAIFLIKWLRPDFFIWENVKGAYSTNAGADYWAIIQAFADLPGYRHEQQLLNTAWFLPQNRERIYSIGHLAGRSEPRVFPFTESYKWINERTQANETAIVRTITAGGHSGGQHSGMTCIRTLMSGNNGGQHQNMTLVRHRSDQEFKEGNIAPTLRNSDKGEIRIVTNTKKGYEEATKGDSINFSIPTSKTRRGRVGKGVAQTLDTQCNQGVIQINNSIESDGKQPYQQNRIYDTKGQSPCLSVGNGSDSMPKIEVKAILTPNRKEKRQNGRRTKENGEPAFTLSCQDQHGVMINNNIRRLTEIECERLQGFPDDWTKYGIYEKQVWINKKEKTFKIIEGIKEIPKTQRYKLCGNAVSVPVVKAIANRLLK